MKQKSFDDQQDNNEEFLWAIMLHKLYVKFQQANPEMSDPESFIAFFASFVSYEELDELVEQERQDVGKAQFDLIMVVIEAHEILNRAAKNPK